MTKTNIDPTAARIPTSLADYEAAFTEALADTSLDADARAAYLSMLARRVREIPWRTSGGQELAARIEAAIDHSTDRLNGLHTLVVQGRVTPAIER